MGQKKTWARLGAFILTTVFGSVMVSGWTPYSDPTLGAGVPGAVANPPGRQAAPADVDAQEIARERAKNAYLTYLLAGMLATQGQDPDRLDSDEEARLLDA